jgi:tetratricopeptide (TPR) repeat protein
MSAADPNSVLPGGGAAVQPVAGESERRLPAAISSVNNDLSYFEVLLCNTVVLQSPFRNAVSVLQAATLLMFIFFMITGNSLAGITAVALMFVLCFVPVWAYQAYLSNLPRMRGITTSLTRDRLVTRYNEQQIEMRSDWTRVASVGRKLGIIFFKLEGKNNQTVCIPERCFHGKAHADEFFDTAMSLWKEAQARKHELGLCSTHKHAVKNNQQHRRLMMIFFTIGGLIVGIISLLQHRTEMYPILWISALAALGLVATSKRYRQHRYLLQANTAIARGDDQAAWQTCQQGLRAHADDANLLISASSALYRLHRVEEGLALCEKALAIEPDNYVGYNNRAYARRELCDLEGALADANHGIQIEPNLLNLFVIRAGILVDLCRYTEALADTDEAHLLDGKHYSPLMMRSFVRMKMNDLARARDEVAAALVLCSGRFSPKELALVQTMVSLIHARSGFYDTAADAASTALQLDSTNVMARTALGMCLCMKGESTKSADCLSQAAGMPKTPREELYFLYASAACQYNLGQLPQARAMAQKAVEISSRPMTLRMLGFIAAAQGDTEFGLQQLDLAIAGDPYDAEAYWMHGRVYQSLRNEQAAQADYAEAASRQYVAYLK